jgi:hypothetical protein
MKLIAFKRSIHFDQTVYINPLMVRMVYSTQDGTVIDIGDEVAYVEGTAEDAVYRLRYGIE